jgi:acetoin utilization deacetylase AcuC-like enzyme
VIYNIFDQTPEDELLPALDDYRPQFVIVSAGFDAHVDDPLANTRLSTAAFATMTRRLVEWTRAHCDGKLVSLLEGGYDLEALAASVEAHVGELLEAAPTTRGEEKSACESSLRSARSRSNVARSSQASRPCPSIIPRTEG